MDHTVQDARQFFDSCPDTYPMYECFVQMLVSRFPETRIKVQKSQISFYNRHLYDCVSFLREKEGRASRKLFCTDSGTGRAFKFGSCGCKARAISGQMDHSFCDQ